jgi:hypothetical protein
MQFKVAMAQQRGCVFIPYGRKVVCFAADKSVSELSRLFVACLDVSLAASMANSPSM